MRLFGECMVSAISLAAVGLTESDCNGARIRARLANADSVERPLLRTVGHLSQSPGKVGKSRWDVISLVLISSRQRGCTPNKVPLRLTTTEIDVCSLVGNTRASGRQARAGINNEVTRSK
jgi:hypothetical protein